jgi:hypothetical protein
MSNENNSGESRVDGSKAKFYKIECPFDLDMVFSMQYDVRGLKGVLEFILEHLGQYKENFDKHQQ